jgi:hypothetical protein
MLIRKQPRSCAKEDIALFNSDEDRVQGLSGNDIQSTDDDMISNEIGGSQENLQGASGKSVIGLVRCPSGMLNKMQDRSVSIGMDSIEDNCVEENESSEEEKGSLWKVDIQEEEM